MNPQKLNNACGSRGDLVTICMTVNAATNNLLTTYAQLVAYNLSKGFLFLELMGMEQGVVLYMNPELSLYIKSVLLQAVALYKPKICISRPDQAAFWKIPMNAVLMKPLQLVHKHKYTHHTHSFFSCFASCFTLHVFLDPTIENFLNCSTRGAVAKIMFLFSLKPSNRQINPSYWEC